MRLITLFVAMAFMGAATRGPSAPTGKVGETYAITMIQESSQESSDDSSATSHDADALIERIVGVRADGVEVEYDLPKDSSDRPSNWQFPARVLRPYRGPLQLLNRPQLESRLDAWLKAANWTREACGRWIFTWNAFRIECDPESVITMVEAFDLRSADIRDGAVYQDRAARAPGTLRRKSVGPNGATFTVELELEPDAVRRARAESDVAVGEMMQKSITLDAALRARSKESVTGTISILFETDAAGNVRRRTKVTKLTIKTPDGQSETDTTTQTLERRLLSSV